MQTIRLPGYITEIMTRLTRAGYEVYAAGGCVRDLLEGREPHDYDLCTSARPRQVREVFSDKTVIDTGIRHGTVTVMYDKIPVEITTFRTEAQYSDGRHPDKVCFADDVESDLARRDFTINAMAYSPARGLVDCFGGAEDLKARRLRCVGRPVQRFSEDGLRILRALRFLSVYGYEPDPETAEAIHTCAPMLHRISWERIDTELMKFFTGKRVASWMDEYRDVFFLLIPELEAAMGYDQCSPYHNRDVWHHILATVDGIRPDGILRLTMLLHDIAKPVVGYYDDSGRGHFKGHAARGEEMAEDILRRMRFSNEIIHRVTLLIRYHDWYVMPDRPDVRRALNRMGYPMLLDLMEVQMADAAGKYEKYEPETRERVQAVLRTAEQVVRDGDCFDRKDLAVSGKDLIQMGIADGRQIGTLLDRLLDAVMDDRLPNEKTSLLLAAKEVMS